MHLVPKGDLHVAIQYAKDIIAKAMAEAGPSGLVFDGNYELFHVAKACRRFPCICMLNGNRLV